MGKIKDANTKQVYTKYGLLTKLIYQSDGSYVSTNELKVAQNEKNVSIAV